VVNLNLMGGKLNTSKVSGSGNRNSVEVYVAGDGQDAVKITLYWDAQDSTVEGSNNGNTIRVFIGEAHNVDMKNQTVQVVDGEKGSAAPSKSTERAES
jgi:tagatose-1,6-bisphosphate aldolase